MGPGTGHRLHRPSLGTGHRLFLSDTRRGAQLPEPIPLPERLLSGLGLRPRSPGRSALGGRLPPRRGRRHGRRDLRRQPVPAGPAQRCPAVLPGPLDERQPPDHRRIDSAVRGAGRQRAAGLFLQSEAQPRGRRPGQPHLFRDPMRPRRSAPGPLHRQHHGHVHDRPGPRRRHLRHRSPGRLSGPAERAHHPGNLQHRQRGRLGEKRPGPGPHRHRHERGPARVRRPHHHRPHLVQGRGIVQFSRTKRENGRPLAEKPAPDRPGGLSGAAGGEMGWTQAQAQFGKEDRHHPQQLSHKGRPGGERRGPGHSGLGGEHPERHEGRRLSRDRHPGRRRRTGAPDHRTVQQRHRHPNRRTAAAGRRSRQQPGIPGLVRHLPQAGAGGTGGGLGPTAGPGLSHR